MKEEIEELEEDDVDVEIRTEYYLNWTCKNCKEENTEYDIPGDGIVECECQNCGKKYTYYNCMY